jgi:hypothetical protein
VNELHVVTLADRIDAYTTQRTDLETILHENDLDGSKVMGIVRTAMTAELSKRRAFFGADHFEDVHSKLVEVAIGLAYDHDPTRSTLSLATRIYRVTRLRTISAIRDRIRDQSRTTVMHDGEDHTTQSKARDDVDAFDLEDHVVTKHQREAWARAANRSGLTITEWLIRTLDTAAEQQLAA